MKERKVLIIGECTEAGSKISRELHSFFEKHEISFKVEHAFSLLDAFQAVSETETFDFVIIDEGMSRLLRLQKIFEQNKCSFNSSNLENGVEECLAEIKKTATGR